MNLTNRYLKINTAAVDAASLYRIREAAASTAATVATDGRRSEKFTVW